MIISYGLPLMLLIMIPLIFCVVCIAIDTFVQFKYYLWNREEKKTEDRGDDNAG